MMGLMLGLRQAIGQALSQVLKSLPPALLVQDLKETSLSQVLRKSKAYSSCVQKLVSDKRGHLALGRRSCMRM